MEQAEQHLHPKNNLDKVRISQTGRWDFPSACLVLLIICGMVKEFFRVFGFEEEAVA